MLIRALFIWMADHTITRHSLHRSVLLVLQARIPLKKISIMDALMQPTRKSNKQPKKRIRMNLSFSCRTGMIGCFPIMARIYHKDGGSFKHCPCGLLLQSIRGQNRSSRMLCWGGWGEKPVLSSHTDFQPCGAPIRLLWRAMAGWLRKGRTNA